MESTHHLEPWNKGKLVGQKPPLKPNISGLSLVNRLGSASMWAGMTMEIMWSLPPCRIQIRRNRARRGEGCLWIVLMRQVAEASRPQKANGVVPPRGRQFLGSA